MTAQNRAMRFHSWIFSNEIGPKLDVLKKRTISRSKFGLRKHAFTYTGFPYYSIIGTVFISNSLKFNVTTPQKWGRLFYGSNMSCKISFLNKQAWHLPRIKDIYSTAGLSAVKSDETPTDRLLKYEESPILVAPFHSPILRSEPSPKMDSTSNCYSLSNEISFLSPSPITICQ